MVRAILCPFLDNKSMVDLYYTFFYPHLIYGIEFWGHASKTDLKKILVLQKAALRVLVYVKPGKHVTSFFSKLKIMPLKILFEFRLLKLLLWAHARQQIRRSLLRRLAGLCDALHCLQRDSRHSSLPTIWLCPCFLIILLASSSFYSVNFITLYA